MTALHQARLVAEARHITQPHPTTPRQNNPLIGWRRRPRDSVREPELFTRYSGRTHSRRSSFKVVLPYVQFTPPSRRCRRCELDSRRLKTATDGKFEHGTEMCSFIFLICAYFVLALECLNRMCVYMYVCVYYQGTLHASHRSRFGLMLHMLYIS